MNLWFMRTTIFTLLRPYIGVVEFWVIFIKADHDLVCLSLLAIVLLLPRGKPQAKILQFNFIVSI